LHAGEKVCAARALAENPDATREIYTECCACGTTLEAAGQELARAWDHVDLPPVKPVTTPINLFRGTCPCCKARVTAQATPGVLGMFYNCRRD